MIATSEKCACGRVFSDLPENEIHCTVHHVDERVPGLFDDPAWDVWDVCGGCGHVFETELDVLGDAKVPPADRMEVAMNMPACPLCGFDWTDDL